MSETIGQVNINLRMSLAQFKQDVKEGTSSAKQATKDLADTTRGSMMEARGSLELLGESVGIHLPRELRTVIAAAPGVGQALSAAFSSVAALAFIEVLTKIVERITAAQDAVNAADEKMQKLNESLQDDILKLRSAHPAWVQLGQDIGKIADAWYEAQKAQSDAVNSLGNKLFGETTVMGYALKFWKDKYHELTDTTNGTADAQRALLADIEQIAKTEGPKAALDELNKRLAMMGDTLGTSDVHVQAIAEHLKSQLATDAKAATDNLAKLNAELQKVIEGAAKLRAGRSTSGPQLTPGTGDIDPSGIFGIGQTLEKLPAPQKPIYSGTKEAEDLYKAQTDQNEAIKDAQKIYTETRTASELYAQQMQLLNVLLSQGAIDQDTFNRAAKQAKDKMTEDTKAWASFGKEVGSTIEQALLFQRSWGDALKAILADLVQVILKMTVLNSLTSSGGGGGFLSSLLGGLFGGHLASGGPVQSGHWYIAGEHGPEPIWGGGPGAFATGYGGGGSAPIVNNYIDARGSSITEEQFRRSLKESEQRSVALAVTQVSELNKRR